MTRTLFFASLILGLAATALAALPPQYAAERHYELLQNAAEQRQTAPEILRIQILAIEKTLVEYTHPPREDIISTMHAKPVVYQMTIAAGVFEVEHSESGLTPGDCITISYQIKDIPPMPGPRRFPIPEPDTFDVTWAYLQQGDSPDTYTLAAGPWSYASPDAFAMEFQEAKAEYDEYW